MASNFFEQQDIARRSTTRLVVLFALAVIAIVISINLLLAATMGYLSRDSRTGELDWSTITSPELTLLAFFGTLVVVGGGSLYKVAQLRGGGRVVAEQLGGRLLHAATTDPAEQKLLNVVEEMAIAAGTATPPVYLMDHEPGINAFAAGFTPSDAVIGVTRGTVNQLSRDELQGVIAHEFSHIMNGDMRLNIRLIGLLHGILIIGMIGYFIMRTAAFSGHGRRSREGNPMALLALGAGLAAIGFFGTFFGNLIKAAVSRQREFLADASAVQFTRDPNGIGGALKKIGGFSGGSKIANPNAPEASHMFFGRATSGLSGLFSTHPPLAERIRRIDPAWDGSVEEVLPAAAESAVAGVSGFAASTRSATSAPTTARVASAVDQIGQPTDDHLRYARSVLENLPTALTSAAREPYGARAVIYALLLDSGTAVRQLQLAQLAETADAGVCTETERLMPAVAALDVSVRLPLLDITLPALRELSASQYRRFMANVTALAEADRQIDLFEWSLYRILVHDLEPHFSKVAPRRVRYQRAASVPGALAVLLSALAHVGQRDPVAANAAFEAGWRRLRLPPTGLQPLEACGLDALNTALATLDEAAPQLKRQVLDAALACITADERVTTAEAELLRAVSASLGCPMPPILAT